VILLTAHADKSEIDRAKQLGVQHVFHKANFTLVQLLRAIEDSVPPQASAKSHA
jgi:CheY-like chemotaxis protein